jgi:hypothetical protein
MNPLEIKTDEARYFLPDEFEGLTTDDVSQNTVDPTAINFAKHFSECRKRDCNFSLAAYFWFLQQCDDNGLPIISGDTLRAMVSGVMGFREVPLSPIPKFKKFFRLDGVERVEPLRVVAAVCHAGLREAALEKLAARGESP